MTRGLTLEEQERRAYASGDASLAADLQLMEEQRDEADRERDATVALLAEAVELLSDEYDPDAAQAWLDANRGSLP